MFDNTTNIEALIVRVRNLQAFLSDAEIAVKIVGDGEGSPENVWLACQAARVLDTDYVFTP